MTLQRNLKYERIYFYHKSSVTPQWVCHLATCSPQHPVSTYTYDTRHKAKAHRNELLHSQWICLTPPMICSNYSHHLAGPKRMKFASCSPQIHVLFTTTAYLSCTQFVANSLNQPKITLICEVGYKSRSFTKLVLNHTNSQKNVVTKAIS